MTQKYHCLKYVKQIIFSLSFFFFCFTGFCWTDLIFFLYTNLIVGGRSSSSLGRFVEISVQPALGNKNITLNLSLISQFKVCAWQAIPYRQWQSMVYIIGQEIQKKKSDCTNNLRITNNSSLQ